MAFSIMNAALPATEMRRGVAGSVTVRPPASTTTTAPAAGAAAAGAEDFPQEAQRQAAAMAATNPGIRMNFMGNFRGGVAKWAGAAPAGTDAGPAG